MNKRIRRIAAGLTLTATIIGGLAVTAGTAAADTHWGTVTTADASTQPTDDTSITDGTTSGITGTDTTVTPLDTHWG